MTEQQKEAIKAAVAALKAACVAAVPNGVSVTLRSDWSSEAALTEVTVHWPNRSGYEAFAMPSASLPAPE